MMLGNYSNQTTNQIVYQAKGFAYGLNGEFVLTICNTFLMLGYDKVYVGITSNYRACIISPVVEAAKNPKKYLGVKVIALQMPLMLHEDSSSKPEDYLGARDVDFGTESKVYYSFVDNEIHDADGKVAKFNPSEYEDGELGYISEENMKLLATYLRKSKAGRSIPILENVAVSKNTVRVTDLESEIILTNVPVEDGIYSIINGAFKPALMELDDYPIPQSERYKGSNSAGSLEVQTLATIFSEAKNMVGDDDLRPAMTGVCIQNEGDVTTFYTKGF
jgi:hypothetical protein